jgi:arsenate reductase
MTIVLWGIPTCGTVKKARAALEAARIPFVDRDLREDPPSAAEIDAVIAAFGAKALRNTSGASYRALPAEKESWSEARWREAFVADPMLVKRPVFVRDGAVLGVGFKDDAVLAKLR